MLLTDLLTQLRISVAPSGHHHARPGWAQLDCPWCGRGSRKYHLGIHINKLFANCWRCGRHSVADVLAAYTHKSWQECKALLADISTRREIDLPRTGRLVLPDGRVPLLPAHRKYLASRRFDPDEIVALWGVEAIGIAAQLAWRVFIPIHLDGECVSWTTRAIGKDVEPRYIAAGREQEAVERNHLLYGWDYVRHAVAIHEGPTDVWRTGPGAAATLGTSYSRAQLRRLASVPTRIVCFDNSPEAQARAHVLCDSLAPFPGRTINVQLDSPDPGSATDLERDQLRQLLDE